ncbi:MAG: hypothetical protein JXA14_21420 [Anaerolineae bacterium]|nr:hypothetical protein [Anaerolineae bacterium]
MELSVPLLLIHIQGRMTEFDEDMDEEWGEYDGQCLACDLWGRVDDLGL